VSITKISPVKCINKSSGFQKNLFQHTKFIHLKYKVQSTKISTCANKQNSRHAAGYNANRNEDKDDNNDKDVGNNNDDDKEGNDCNNYISGEIIPILFSETKVNRSSCHLNQALILLDVGYFRFEKHELCRPYVALQFVENNDDNDDIDYEDDNDNDNNNDDNDNNNNNHHKYFSLQLQLTTF
jgi:hypothetical protein